MREGAAPTDLLRVDDLHVQYPVGRGAVVRALDGVSLELRTGRTLGIVGESGSGKSTIARALLQLVRPSAGHIAFRGQALASIPRAELGRQIGMVFQNPLASLNPRMQVGTILADPLLVNGIGDRRERRSRAAEMLELVGLSADCLDRYPHAFSGGQRQRIGIARALMLEPALLICDEPVAALDVGIQAQILNLLQDLQRRLGFGMLFIGHDLPVVRHVADDVLVLYIGKVMEQGGRDAVFAQPRHPYTRALIDAAHVPDTAQERGRAHSVLIGEMPNPADRPPGCRFQTRCPLRQALDNPPICASLAPPFQPIEPDHRVACHFAVEGAAHSPITDIKETL